jgi:hypothetical protein
MDLRWHNIFKSELNSHITKRKLVMNSSHVYCSRHIRPRYNSHHDWPILFLSAPEILWHMVETCCINTVQLFRKLPCSISGANWACRTLVHPNPTRTRSIAPTWHYFHPERRHHEYNGTDFSPTYHRFSSTIFYKTLPAAPRYTDKHCNTIKSTSRCHNAGYKDETQWIVHSHLRFNTGAASVVIKQVNRRRKQQKSQENKALSSIKRPNRNVI